MRQNDAGRQGQHPVLLTPPKADEDLLTCYGLGGFGYLRMFRAYYEVDYYGVQRLVVGPQEICSKWLGMGFVRDSLACGSYTPTMNYCTNAEDLEILHRWDDNRPPD
jgi:hypothetical protein